MRVLEIGCGTGRMTRAIAASFGEVHAVDISAEMIAAAKRNLSDLRNVFLHKNNGIDLSEIPDQSCDFAFSFIVFQHIPIPGVIETYVRAGAVFKFQVQGDTGIQIAKDDTWVGVPMSLADARALAEGSQFELLCASGQGTQYFWLWFLKPKWPWIPKVIRSNAREVLTRMRSAIERPVAVAFSPQSVRAGESYGVRIPGFAGQVIDIGYELMAAQCPAPVTGVVGRWCQLDSRGEASIRVPAEHPTGTVRITKVRSRTKGSRWYRAEGAIPVAGTDQPPGHWNMPDGRRK
jgi:SAM-dependent methyltransferase